jgi:hypothetical protein
MGRTGRSEYVPVLEAMLKDSGQHARSQALKALIRIRKLQRQAAGMAAAETAVERQEPAEEAATNPSDPPAAPDAGV